MSEVSSTPTASAPSAGEKWLIIGLTLLYAGVLACAVWPHTLWRDEADMWIVARDSHNLIELLHNSRYEGHPPGWYLVLYGITRFTWNPIWLKLTNSAFAVATAGLILRATRVPLAARIGLIGSYFFMFEYAAINRNYMMGILLLVITLFIMRRSQSAFAVPLALTAAALTSLPAMIVAICFYPLHLVPLFRNSRGNWRERLRSLTPQRIVALAVFCTTVLVALARIWPGPDSGLLLDSKPQTGLLVSLAHPFHDLAKAYLPVFPWGPMFWGNNVLAIHSPGLFTAAGVLLAVALCFFFRSTPVRAFFISASLVLIAQMAVSRRSEERHVGWLFVVFALALLLRQVEWLAEPQQARPERVQWRSVLLFALLGTQVVAGLSAVFLSTRYTFSGSRDAARFLQANGLGEGPIIFAPGYISLSPLAYLQRGGVYYVERHALGSVIIWDKAEYYGRHLPTSDEMHAAAVGGVRPFLVTQGPLSAEKMAELDVRQLATFSGEIAPDHYYIYR